MSHPSTLPRIASLLREDVNAQIPNREAVPYSAAYMQKTNPLLTGLITPPESPVRYAQEDSLDDIAAQSSVPFISGANPSPLSTDKAKTALDALFAAVQDTKANANEPNDAIFSKKALVSEAIPVSAMPIDFNNTKEIIYSIIEQAVEEKMTEAVGPLRLNTSQLEKSLVSFHRENADIRDQNDTLSRQLDLHYRTIEQNVEEFKSQSKTMLTLIGAQADNLAATISMLGHLSQVVTNLPMALNQIVYTAVQQQTQLAFRDIMFAQQQAMFSVSEVSGTRQSVSSDGSSSQCTCHHHGLEIESMSSMQHSNGSSNSTSSRRNRGLRYSLKKLFKSSK
ncbi:hypothetical protein GGI43DRAFT_378379 [Trichoderma evansii]